MAMRDEVISKLREVLTRDFKVPEKSLKEDSHFRKDLHLDSLALVDLIYLVQRDFGFKADTDEFRELFTLGKLADFIVAKKAAKP